MMCLSWNGFESHGLEVVEQREYKFGGFEGGEEDVVKTESCLVPSYV